MNFLKLTSQTRPGRLFTILSRNHVTTHHTIVSREKDQRWKGIQNEKHILFKYLSLSLNLNPRIKILIWNELLTKRMSWLLVLILIKCSFYLTLSICLKLKTKRSEEVPPDYRLQSKSNNFANKRAKS